MPLSFEEEPRGFLSILKKFWKTPKTRKRIIVGLGVISSMLGVYILVLIATPFIYYSLQEPAPETTFEELIIESSTEQGVESVSVPLPQENRLVIPSLMLDLEIYEGGLSSLDKGIWHRLPDNGNPVDGGNFILTGHRFNIGLTPAGTLRKSPLYNVHNLTKRDLIKVYWEQEVYKYKIIEIYEVKPSQVEIEAKTDEAVLTLYTCTFGGSSDGRVVVQASPL